MPTVGVFSSAYSSSNITDTTLGVGKNFDVQINVTNPDAVTFSGYELVLYYDRAYITVASYDDATGTLLSNPYLSPNSDPNGPGAFRLGVVNAGPSTSSSGLLVTVIFTVLKVGVSPLVLAAGTGNPSSAAVPPAPFCSPACPSGAPNWTRLVSGLTSTFIDVATSDGYFKDVAGSSGPVASFSFSPPSPSQGQTVTFDATNSIDPDNKAAHNSGIATYFWDFGDRSSQANTTTVFPVSTHDFKTTGTNAAGFVGNFSVRLTVLDSDNNFEGMITRLVTISPQPNHCVEVIAVSPKSDKVQPGQNVSFTVQVQNSGTFIEKYDLTVIYGPPNATLPTVIGQNITIGKIVSYQFSFSTSKLLQGVYNIIANVTLYGAANCKTGLALQQIEVTSQSSPGSLLLLIASGVVVLAVAIVGISLIRRRRRHPLEPL